MSVISFPKQVTVPIYHGLPLYLEHGVNLPVGQVLSVSASAELVILNRTGDDRILAHDGERLSTSFRWTVPAEDLYGIPHGTPYRIYIDNGTLETRVIAQSGSLVWIA